MLTFYSPPAVHVQTHVDQLLHEVPSLGGAVRFFAVGDNPRDQAGLVPHQCFQRRTSIRVFVPDGFGDVVNFAVRKVRAAVPSEKVY